ncbi:MAG: hypothetical protein CMN73_13630 [Sphingomonas sp.]|nr:hypothetical protein [Sphingomonas sp.]
MRRPTPAAALAAAVLALAIGSLAACSGPRIIPAPAEPIPVPTPVPTPTPTPVVQMPTGDWRDWAVTPGDWVYRQDGRGSIALFGQPGLDADVTLRCDRSAGQIFLSRKMAVAPAGPLALTVRASTMLRQLSMQPVGGGQPYIAAALDPRDPLLDAMGFSRGRFILEGGGMQPLVIPAWPETLRVIEDCRK